MPLPLIIAAVSAAAAVGGAVKGGIDADKKRFFEQQLSFMSMEEKRKLEKQLASAKSEEERQKIFASAIDNITAARVKGLSLVQVEREKTKKQAITLAIVGGVVVLLTIFLVSRRS